VSRKGELYETEQLLEVCADDRAFVSPSRNRKAVPNLTYHLTGKRGAEKERLGEQGNQIEPKNATYLVSMLERKAKDTHHCLRTDTIESRAH
jgi:hypothetical protein